MRVYRPTRARLQRFDRTTDAAPHGPPIGIAQLKHAVDHPRRLDQRIRAMSTDNQIGRAVDVQVRDHDAALAGLGRLLDHLISRPSPVALNLQDHLLSVDHN